MVDRVVTITCQMLVFSRVQNLYFGFVDFYDLLVDLEMMIHLLVLFGIELEL